MYTFAVVVDMDAELDDSSVDDVSRTEDRIVSQWKEISADEQHQLRERVDEIFRPLGLQTRLIVLDRAESLALIFICMTLSALMRLRDQFTSGQLKDIFESLFTFLSVPIRTVRIKRLFWSELEYEQCLKLFSSAQGKQSVFVIILGINKMFILSFDLLKLSDILVVSQ